jgi:hypothetical protein
MTTNVFRSKNSIEVLGTTTRVYGSAIFGPSEFQFDPASLFASGEVGHWAGGYDPVVGRLFQDSFGTTGATVAAQPVGLALGIQKGTALGPELVTNGGFDTDTAWFKTSGVTISGGQLVFSNVGGGGHASQNISFPGPSTYKVTFVVTNYSGGTIFARIRIAGGLIVVFGVGGNGAYDVLLAPNFTPNQFELIASGNGGNATATFDNISVREVPGNHALQATALSRPTLSRVPRGGRRNLLTHTEDFGNAAWVKTVFTVTENQIVAPDGTVTADLLTQGGGGAVQSVSQVFTGSADTHTLSVHVKKGTRRFFVLALTPSAAADIGDYAWFDLDTGIVAARGVNLADSEIVPVGSGWFRISVTKALTAVSLRAAITHSDLDNNLLSGGGGTSYIWGAQLELGSTATPYQRVVSARDVTEAGVQDVWHLNNDGNDSLPATLPAGTYTAAWVNALGAVTITPNVSVTTTLDTLRGQDQADALIINRTLTEAERAALTLYWQLRYAP